MKRKKRMSAVSHRGYIWGSVECKPVLNPYYQLAYSAICTSSEERLLYHGTRFTQLKSSQQHRRLGQCMHSIELYDGRITVCEDYGVE